MGCHGAAFGIGCWDTAISLTGSAYFGEKKLKITVDRFGDLFYCDF